MERNCVIDIKSICYKIRSNNLDIYFAYFGACIGLIFLIISIVLGMSIVIKEMILFSSFAFFTYIVLQKHIPKESYVDEQNVDFKNYKSKRIYLYLINVAYFILITLCFILSYTYLYERSTLFLIIVCITAILLGIEIIQFQTNFKFLSSFWTFSKIIVLAILIRSSIYYQFPGVVGVDPFYHIDFINYLLMNGFLRIGDTYFHFPAMHIFVAAVSIISNLSPIDSFFFIGIIEVISLIFVYLLGKKLFNNQIGLLSCLIISLSSEHILWGYWIIAMSFALCLIPMLIYILFTKNDKNNKIYTIFVLFIILIVYLTHTVASFVLLLYLIIYWFFSHSMNILPFNCSKRNLFGIFFVVISLLLLSFYWIYISDFFEYIGGSIVNSFRFTKWDKSSVSGTKSLIESTWDYLGINLFGFFSIIGTLFILNIKNRNINRIHLILTSLCMTICVFFLYISGSNAVLFGRWPVFIMLFLSIPCSLGIYMTLFISKKYQLVTIVIVLLIFSSVMVLNNNSNITEVVPWAEYPRYGLTDSESQSYSQIYLNTVNSNDKIYCDSIFISSIRHGIFYDEDRVFPLSLSLIRGETTIDGTIILRNEMLNNRVQLVNEGAYRNSIAYTMSNNYYHYFQNEFTLSKTYDSGSCEAIVGTFAS